MLWWPRQVKGVSPGPASRGLAATHFCQLRPTHENRVAPRLRVSDAPAAGIRRRRMRGAKRNASPDALRPNGPPRILRHQERSEANRSKPCCYRAGFVPIRKGPPDPPTEASRRHRPEGASHHSPRRTEPTERGTLKLKSDFWLLFSLWKKVTRRKSLRSRPAGTPLTCRGSHCDQWQRRAYQREVSRPP